MSDQFHETADDILHAATVTIGTCSCPDVHILLLDASGQVIARAIMSPEDFAAAASSVAETVASVRAEQGDTIGDVVGRA